MIMTVTTTDSDCTPAVGLVSRRRSLNSSLVGPNSSSKEKQQQQPPPKERKPRSKSKSSRTGRQRARGPSTPVVETVAETVVATVDDAKEQNQEKKTRAASKSRRTRRTRPSPVEAVPQESCEPKRRSRSQGARTARRRPGTTEAAAPQEESSEPKRRSRSQGARTARRRPRASSVSAPVPPTVEKKTRSASKSRRTARTRDSSVLAAPTPWEHGATDAATMDAGETVSAAPIPETTDVEADVEKKKKRASSKSRRTGRRTKESSVATAAPITVTRTAAALAVIARQTTSENTEIVPKSPAKKEKISPNSSSNRRRGMEDSSSRRRSTGTIVKEKSNGGSELMHDDSVVSAKQRSVRKRITSKSGHTRTKSHNSSSSSSGKKPASPTTKTTPRRCKTEISMSSHSQSTEATASLSSTHHDLDASFPILFTQTPALLLASHLETTTKTNEEEGSTEHITVAAANTTGKQKRKVPSVRFMDAPQVVVQDSVVDKRSTSAKWYSKQDLNMLLEYEMRINSIRAKGKKIDMHYCYRGLEEHQMAQQEQQQQQLDGTSNAPTATRSCLRDTYSKQVLALQDYQQQESLAQHPTNQADVATVATEDLRRKCRSWTKEDRKLAYRYGLQDASDVQLIIASDDAAAERKAHNTNANNATANPKYGRSLTTGSLHSKNHSSRLWSSSTTHSPRMGRSARLMRSNATRPSLSSSQRELSASTRLPSMAAPPKASSTGHTAVPKNRSGSAHLSILSRLSKRIQVPK